MGSFDAAMQVPFKCATQVIPEDREIKQIGELKKN